MIKLVNISRKAQETILNEVKRIPSLETGGVFCGHYLGDILMIDVASGPGPKAVHRIDHFIMDKEYMHKFIDAEYSSSEGMSIYIGEWHTHPEIHPEPSQIDLTSIRERSYEWSHGDIIFIILGFVGLNPSTLKEQLIALHYSTDDQEYYEMQVNFE